MATLRPSVVDKTSDLRCNSAENLRVSNGVRFC